MAGCGGLNDEEWLVCGFGVELRWLVCGMKVDGNGQGLHFRVWWVGEMWREVVSVAEEFGL